MAKRAPDPAKPLKEKTKVDFRNHAASPAPFRAVIYPPTEKQPQHRIRYWLREEPFKETRRGRTWGDVIAWLEVQRQAAMADTVGPVKVTTLGEAIDGYLGTIADKSANYRKAETDYLERMRKQAGKTALPVLGPSDIQPALKDRSRYTAQRMRATLKRCLDYARRQQAIERARADWIVDGLELPSDGAKALSHQTYYPDELPSREQLQEVADLLEEPYRLLWWLTAGCYLRPSEAIALGPENLQGDWIRVDRALVVVSPPPGEEPYKSDPGLPNPPARNLVMKAPKTTSGYRDVKVPVSVGGYKLRERLKEHAKGIEPGQPLFPAPQGGWWDLSSLTGRIFRPATASVEGWHWRPYQILRHWGISTLVNRPDVRVIDVSRSAGHASVVVTQEKYLRRRQDEESTPDEF